MEVFSTLFRIIDSLFMAVTIGLGTLLLALNITFPPLTSHIPANPPPAITEPITSTTVSLETDAPTEIEVVEEEESLTQLPVATAPAATTPPPASTLPTVDYETLNINARAALVNILCISKSGVGSISGSGTIIDPRGIILTNAHIGQFFLLKDYLSPNNVECTIRTGSPAVPKYHAELIYLPPAWVDANADQLKAEKAMGTGEHDYAFLRITSTTAPGGTLPASFPSLSTAPSDPTIGEEVLLAAYPAGFLEGTSIERDLYITSAFTVVQKLFTFDEQGFIDVVSIGGTVVSQGGSSGGTVVRSRDGTLLGIITTATAGATTGDRDLRAIVVTHINRSMAEQGAGSIFELLAKDPATTAANFAADIAPHERQKLIEALSQ